MINEPSVKDISIVDEDDISITNLNISVIDVNIIVNYITGETQNLTLEFKKRDILWRDVHNIIEEFDFSIHPDSSLAEVNNLIYVYGHEDSEAAIYVRYCDSIAELVRVTPLYLAEQDYKIIQWLNYKTD